MSEVRVGVVQLCSTADRAANAQAAERWIREAAGRGAQVVCLPEMWPYIGRDSDKVDGGETLDGPTVTAMRRLAKELGIWLFPGSFAERSEQPGRIHNTAPVIDPEGEVRAVYRKLHLFDIDIPGGPAFRESDTVAPGDRAVVVDALGLRWGLTVCYDLRFPGLYRALRDAGADVILVPAAFTSHTGKDHWEVLLRARAIEQQVYVVAPDQGGRHNAVRESHGHSMLVDPWGLVTARASTGPGVVVGSIDPAEIARVRRAIPCAEHRRPFHPPTIA